MTLENVELNINEEDHPILSIDSLDVEKGEVIAVVGPNGAGKSTLLNVVSGNLTRDLRRGLTGSISIGGQPVDKPVNQTIDGVGVVNQNDTDDLIHNLSVAQNIAIRQLLGGGHSPALFATPRSWKRNVAEKLGQFLENIDRDLNRKVGSFSGGERQLINVTIAIHLEHDSNPCNLLLLDEHTANLDYDFANDVMDFTSEQVQETGTTVLMVTHNFEEAIRIADRIVVMKGGSISGTLQNTKDNSASSADIVDLL